MQAIAAALPATYPGTGFDIATTPLAAYLTLKGRTGAVPASVRQAEATTPETVETFFAGRSGVVPRIHYLRKLNQSLPHVSLVDPFINIRMARVSEVVRFLHDILDLKDKLAKHARKTTREIDLADIMQEGAFGTYLHLAPTPQDVRLSGANHRFIGWMLSPWLESESGNAMRSRQLMTLIAIFLHDVLYRENIEFLPLSGAWGPGDRRATLRRF